MTIKQQGGIFGRNPSFNEVEVSDLTVTSVTVSGYVSGNVVIRISDNRNFDSKDVFVQ